MVILKRRQFFCCKLLGCVFAALMNNQMKVLIIYSLTVYLNFF